MKFRAILVLAVAGFAWCGIGPLAYSAESNVKVLPSTEQVIERLVNSANLGAARGLCIGRVETCLSTLEKASATEMIVSFELNSSQLSEEAQAVLQRIAEALNGQRLQHAKIVVEGYADAIGPEWYNKRLSRQRARNVADYLLEIGLPKDRLSTVGVGEIKPHSEDEFDPSNRRVEVRIVN